MQKIASNPKDLAKFTSRKFKGFDNLSDKEVEVFYNRYFLELDVDDSVRVISEKIVTKEQLTTMLISAFTESLPRLSDIDLQKYANEYFQGQIKLEGVKVKDIETADLKLEEIIQIPEKPASVPAEKKPFEIEPGETDDDELHPDDIEEDADDFDMDDTVWVDAPEEGAVFGDSDKGMRISNADIQPESRAIKSAKAYTGGFTPIKLSRGAIEGSGIGEGDDDGDDGMTDTRNTKYVSRARNSHPDDRDVRQEIKSSVLRRKRGSVEISR